MPAVRSRFSIFFQVFPSQQSLSHHWKKIASDSPRDRLIDRRAQLHRCDPGNRGANHPLLSFTIRIDWAAKPPNSKADRERGLYLALPSPLGGVASVGLGVGFSGGCTCGIGEGDPVAVGSGLPGAIGEGDSVAVVSGLPGAANGASNSPKNPPEGSRLDWEGDAGAAEEVRACAVGFGVGAASLKTSTTRRGWAVGVGCADGAAIDQFKGVSALRSDRCRRVVENQKMTPKVEKAIKTARISSNPREYRWE